MAPSFGEEIEALRRDKSKLGFRRQPSERMLNIAAAKWNQHAGTVDRVDIIWHGRRFYSTLLAMRMRGYRAADGRQICARWHIAKEPRGRQQEKRRPSAEPPFVVRHDRAAMIASQFCDPRNANDMPKSIFR